MGVEVVLGASLLATVASSYEQYRTAKRAERQQEKRENIQAGLQEINNRRDAIRRIARERVGRASALAAAQARGASGDSAVEGQVGGLRSALGADVGQIFSQQIAGDQLSGINQRLASLQTDSARAQAVGAFSNTIFQGAGGFQSLFSSGESGTPSGGGSSFIANNPASGSTDLFSSSYGGRT